MTISTNNGLVNGPVHILLMQFFTLGSSKIEFFKSFFFDMVTLRYYHPRYVKHVLGCIYVFFTLFGCWVFFCSQPGGPAGQPAKGSSRAASQGDHPGRGDSIFPDQPRPRNPYP